MGTFLLHVRYDTLSARHRDYEQSHISANMIALSVLRKECSSALAHAQVLLITTLQAERASRTMN